MKVCFITFGCRLNRAEALEEEAAYLAKGWEITEKHAEADTFVVRGCSVTARAQRDCEKLIAHLRRKYPMCRLVVCGCLKQKESVDSPLLPAPSPVLDALVSSAVPTRTARAYLKVQDGCSGKCTFCIVPQFRGNSISVPYAAVLDKAKRFIDAGYHEIVVTGCNLSLYASEGKRLPDLLVALTGLSGDCRIRLGSLEPGACAMDTVDVFAEQDNLCRFLHLPIQSGSNTVLADMRRNYLMRDVEYLLAKIRRCLPNIGLGCDLMTGFPGESEIDFLATQSLLERFPFNNAHIFPYSERPDTPAAARLDSVPRSVRSQRAHILAKIIREKRKLFARRFIGREVEIIVEDEKHRAGWTSEYLWVEAPTYGFQTPLTRKSRVRVRIANANSKGLVAY